MFDPATDLRARGYRAAPALPSQRGVGRHEAHRGALRAVIAAAAVAMIALLWAGIWFHLSTMRASDVAKAESTANNLARTLEEHMLRTLTAIDQVLLRMRALYASHPGPFDVMAAMPEAQGVLDVAVGAYLADADGRVIWSSTGKGQGRYVGDREHFTVQARSRDDAVYISKPVTGRVSGKLSIQVTRRVTRPDGSFGGIVVVALDPGYLDQFYKSIDLGPQGTTTMFGLDGVVRARSARDPARVGQDMADGPVMRAQSQKPQGLLDCVSRFDGLPKLIAYRRLEAFPVVVTVAIGETDALAAFAEQRRAVVLAGLAITALVGGLAVVLLRQLARIDQANRALAASEERYQLLIDGSREGMYDRDLVAGTIWFSDRAHRLLGLADGTLNGDRSRLLALIHPNDLLDYEAAIAKLQAAREPYISTLFRMRHADGSWRWIETRGRAVYRDDGTPLRAVGSFGDITDLREAEQALRQSEERHALVVDGMREGLFDRDFKANTAWFSSQAHELLGLPDGALNGDREIFASLIHADDRLRYEADIRRGQAERCIHNMASFRIRHADGAWRGIALRGRALYDEAGRIVRAVGSIGDINEQKLAEQALLESEARFRALIEHSADVYYIVRPTGEVLYRSPSASKTFGYQPAEIIGQSILDRVHRDDVEWLAASLRSPGGAAPTRSEGTARVRHQDGSWRHVSWACSDATEIPGIRGKVLNVRDVTDAVMMEAQLRQAQKMEAVGRLAGGIAHDFNNILGAIMGFSGLLVEDLPSGSTERDFALRIAKASDRGKQLVQQILAFSRHTSVEREPTDLGHVVRDIRELLASSMPATTRLEVAVRDEGLVAEANVGQITQILLNLCINANDALTGKPGSVSIELSGVRPGDPDYAAFRGDPADGGGGARAARASWGSLNSERAYARIEVEDTGHGMDAKLLTQIFDPFFTTKAPGHGTGLGLSVVHGTVLSYEGAGLTISRPGAGTVFTIYLPLLETVPRRAGSSQPTHRGTGTVLLIDDDCDLADAMAIGLERLGYTVVTANDPDQAIAIFAAAPDRWSVVVSDQTMPGMTGLTLHGRLKAIDPELRFILCTGFSDGTVERAARDAAIDAVFIKPVPTRRLVACIREIADATALRRSRSGPTAAQRTRAAARAAAPIAL